MGECTVNDGRTKKVETVFPGSPGPRKTFLARHRASLIMLSGPSAGMEWSLEGARAMAGRSSKAVIALDDDGVSNEHAIFELDEEGYGVRDLASTNGVFVNGQSIFSVALEHGDRIQLGACELQYVVEERPEQPRAWSVDEDA